MCACVSALLLSHLAKTLSCEGVAHLLLGSGLVAVTWPAVGVAIEPVSTAITLAADNVALTSENNHEQLLIQAIWSGLLFRCKSLYLWTNYSVKNITGDDSWLLLPIIYCKCTYIDVCLCVYWCVCVDVCLYVCWCVSVCVLMCVPVPGVNDESL